MDTLEKDKAPLWSEQEFKRVELGDQRLNKRLKKLTEDLSAAPEAPINQASKDWAATKAAYRFFQNDKVTSEKIRAGSFRGDTLVRSARLKLGRHFSLRSP